MTDAQTALAQVREALQRVVKPAVLLTTTKEISIILDHVEAQAAENERLRAGLRAVSDLIDESHGVAGLHRNGDVAPWGDLRTGGKYEEWLVSFDAALKEQRCKF